MIGSDLGALSDADRTQRAGCESVVEAGTSTFVQVGQALATIRDERLYRDTHESFSNYAHDRFGLGRSAAYRMIDAAAVVGSPAGWKITTERQARELTPLLHDPQRLAEAVADAERSGPITAASLRAARIALETPTWEDTRVDVAAVVARMRQPPTLVSMPAVMETPGSHLRQVESQEAAVHLDFAHLLLAGAAAMMADDLPAARTDGSITGLHGWVVAVLHNMDDRPEVLAALRLVDRDGLADVAEMLARVADWLQPDREDYDSVPDWRRAKIRLTGYQLQVLTALAETRP